MSISEQLRAITTQIAQLQRVADWETQIELAKAATVLAKEANRLDGLRVRATTDVDVAAVGGLRR